jgi:hypothetical protein
VVLLERIVLQFEPEQSNARERKPGEFILYVEGPRDREILRAWAYRLQPTLAGRIIGASVILGGRQPRRALEHFRARGGTAAGARAVCLLDRDDGFGRAPSSEGESGLEFFTWTRRHIESYLLVPNALRRALCLDDGDGTLDRILRRHLPAADDERAIRDLDAKKLIGRNGVLPRELGRQVPLSGVARATREHELHPDVHALFGRLQGLVANGKRAVDRLTQASARD